MRRLYQVSVFRLTFPTRLLPPSKFLPCQRSAFGLVPFQMPNCLKLSVCQSPVSKTNSDCALAFFNLNVSITPSPSFSLRLNTRPAAQKDLPCNSNTPFVILPVEASHKFQLFRLSTGS